MKNLISLLAFVSFSAFAVTPVLAGVERVAGEWVIEGEHPIVFTCGGGTYPHTLEDGFPGAGHYDANPAYTWDITGLISGDAISFTLVYDGINAGYTLNGTGTIAADGSISGTTDGNCQAFEMPAGTATRFEGNHGQYVSSQENKKEAAQSRVGMPVQSKGHTK